jgi:intracellular septation protein
MWQPDDLFTRTRYTLGMTDKPKLSPLVKIALDLGPLVVFFAANARFGIFAATGVFMAAIVASLAVSYALTRHVAVMPVVSAVIVLVFGSLTLVLHDETFIKVKPTILYALFGLTLLAGYLLNKPLLAIVFDAMFHLTEEGWRKLTLRWAAFFIVMAVVNEIVWRTQTTQFWISFKLFGFTPLTFLFGALQYPLLMKYASEQPNPEAEAEREEV